MIIITDILKLTRQLLPTGRAWKVPINGYFEKLLKGLGVSELTAYNFALNTLNRILPDNTNFTASDASEWERRLGLPVNPYYVSLTQRKALILRKYQFPGQFLNRQNAKYIEEQLIFAGFDVTVTENTDPDLVIGEIIRHSSTTRMGYNSRHSSIVSDIIANSSFYGEQFKVNTAKGVFLINGNIPPNLITTFRKLVLTLKPVNTVAVMNVTYVNVGFFTYINNDNIITIDGQRLNLIANA